MSAVASQDIDTAEHRQGAKEFSKSEKVLSHGYEDGSGEEVIGHGHAHGHGMAGTRRVSEWALGCLEG